MQQNLEDPTEFTVMETWRNVKALEFHASTSHFAELIKVIGTAADDAPQIRITRAIVPAS